MRLLLPLAGGLALFTGCIVERDYAPTERADFPTRDIGGDVEDEWRPDDGAFVDEDDGGALPITTGRIRGDIGAVRGFDAPTDYVDSWSDISYTSITLNATDADGRVGMFILELVGFDLRSAAPGTYTYGAQSVTSDGDIYVTGCSNVDDSFYDAPAEDGTVVVQDGPDGRDVVVQATLPGGDGGGATRAEAAFRIE